MEHSIQRAISAAASAVGKVLCATLGLPPPQATNTTPVLRPFASASGHFFESYLAGNSLALFYVPRASPSQSRSPALWHSTLRRVRFQIQAVPKLRRRQAWKSATELPIQGKISEWLMTWPLASPRTRTVSAVTLVHSCFG